MGDAIRALTAEELRASARAAAERHVPLREANDFEPGSPQWHAFNAAYQDEQATVHEQRLAEAA